MTKKEELRDQLRKGICPICYKDLSTDEEYEYVYCEHCGRFKMGFRELRHKQQ